MKERRTCGIRMGRTCPLVSIGIVALSATALYASDVSQKQGPSVVSPTGQATTAVNTSTDKSTGRPALQQRNPRYQLCKGDIFDLAFPFTPGFNQTITVQPDGYITLTGVGDLHVAGQTIPELRDALKKLYGEILQDPVINVVLKDFEKPYFVVWGEIVRPGKFDMRDDTTATQAVAIAGGFTENSKHSQVLLFRRISNDWVEVKQLNVKKMFQTENLSEDPHLQPGDMLFVPKSRIAKIRKYLPYPNLGMYMDPSKL